jgi:uncharacterized protein (DUF305 family)
MYRLTLLSFLLMLLMFPAKAEQPAPMAAQAKFEVRFMSGMIDHHQMAIMMAEMCTAKAAHEELRAMCEQIVATQTQEQQSMQTWLQDWYGMTHAPEVSPGMAAMMERMATMSPSEFEIHFMKEMIRHHWKAVIEGGQCIRRAYHNDLVELCEDIALAQTAEIRQMQEWLCEWYAICDYGPKA